MSLKGNEKLKRLNEALNALYMEQDDLYSAYAAHFGLSDTAFWILYAICEGSEVRTQNSLAALFHIPPQSINSAAATLIQQGYVRLEQLPGARSGKALHLTEAGQVFCARVILPFFTIEEQALGALGEDAERYVEFARRETAATRDGIEKAIQKANDTNKTAENIPKETL